MSGKGPASGFDFQSRVNAYIAVHILAKRPLRWTVLATGDVPVAVRAESGRGADDARVEFAGSEAVYECQAKRGLSADTRLDEATDLFTALKGYDHERGILVVDGRSASTIRIGLLEDLNLWRQGVRQERLGALKRVVDRLRNTDAESVVERLHVVVLDVELDAAPGAQVALNVLERILADSTQADAAWGVLVADGLRLCREGGRRTYDHLVALLAQAKIPLAEAAEDGTQVLSEVRSMVQQLVANSASVSAPDRGTDAPDRFTIQLDTAKQLIDDGRASAGLDVLQSVAGVATTAAPATRVRLHNLTGVALYHLGRLDDARTEIRSALDVSPEDKTALANLAQIELMLGNGSDALDYAARAIAADPTSSGAWVVRAQLDPTAEIPEAVAASASVLTALGVVALRDTRWHDATTLLRRALSSDGGTAETPLLLAQAIYGGAFTSRDAVTHRETLDEAVRLLDERVLARRDRLAASLVERAHLTRGQIQRFLGNVSAAAADFANALAIAPNSAASAHLAALAHLDLDEPAKALFIIEAIADFTSRPQLQLVRGRALVALGQPEDARLALEDAVRLLPDDEDRALLLLAIAETALEAGAGDLAQAALAKAAAESWLEALFQARIAAIQGNDQEARDAFERAVSSVPGNDAPLVKAEFASFLRRQGDPAHAVRLLEEAGAADDAELRPLYARCLYEAREIVKAAALLDRVKAETNELPRWALHLGANIALTSDDLPALILYLEQFHARDSSENEVTLRLAQAYLRARRSSDALGTLDELRQRHDIAPRQLLHMAELYIRAGRPTDAAPLAYQALRSEPDAEDIQLAYLSIFHRREDEEAGLDADVVASNTAVELTTDRGEELRYFIVDDGPPRRDAGEISADDPIAKDLIGKRVGDTIVLRPGSLSEASATISGIKTHLVHAFQEIFRRFPERHPQSVALQSFKIPDEPTIDDFSFITESLKEKAEYGKTLLAKYSEIGLPLGVLAHGMRGTLVDAYWAVVSSGTHAFLAEFQDARQDALEAARNDRPVVVTRTALVTLEHLGILELLAGAKRRLVVPRSLIDEMDEERRELAEKAKRGYLGMVYTEQGPIHQTAPPEYFQAALVRFDAVATWIQEHCEILPRPLGAIDREDERLRNVLGDSSLDSLALAHHVEGELFADDLGLRRLHLERSKRYGFSTYTFLLAHRGVRVSEYDADRYVAELVRFRQTSILVTPAVFAAGFAARGFKLDAGILPFLDMLRPPAVPIGEVIMFMIGALVELALTRGGSEHVGQAAYALIEAAGAERNATQIVTIAERVARVRMQLLPTELDAVLAAYERYSRFVIKRLPAVLPSET